MCRQISLDCMFLESQCIIDYSLLLGLHFRAPALLKGPTEPQDTVQNHSSSLVHDGKLSFQHDYLLDINEFVFHKSLVNLYTS